MILIASVESPALTPNRVGLPVSRGLRSAWRLTRTAAVQSVRSLASMQPPLLLPGEPAVNAEGSAPSLRGHGKSEPIAASGDWIPLPFLACTGSLDVCQDLAPPQGPPL